MKLKRALDYGVEQVPSGIFGDMTRMGTRTMRSVKGLVGNGCRAWERFGCMYRLSLGGVWATRSGLGKV